SNALSFTIANLNDNERTLLKAFKSEFASMSSMLVMQDFDDYQADYSDQNIVQYFIMKLYLKPKKIENKSHRDVWLHALSMENVTLAARSKADNIKGMDEMSWWDIYLDPLSYLLLAIATPSHHGYIDMIDHLDARISLLNLKSDIYTKNLAAEEISRYISTMAVGDNAGYAGSEFFWDRENSELTYAVPNYTSEDIPRVKLYFNGQ
ncbi:MAG: hypothetical protein OQK32_08815, partial [Gammaproteobacteria bacterium]|nr:hypothetical protein [Gammaproteobacteria bacterium]